MAQVSYGTITITDITDIDSIVNYYLATSASSGVTRATTGWTTAIQSMTSTNQYLWNYEQILGANNTLISQTDPVIIGRYGQNGVDGNSITSIDEYYQATNLTTNPGPTGWQKNTLVVPTSVNKYLWNYQVINYSKTAAEGSYLDARIIGIYGDKGETGDTGPQGTSVTGVRELYYLKTNSTNPSTITSSSQITATDRQNGWTSIVPTFVNNGVYYTCAETSLSSGGPIWSDPIENEGLTTSNQNALNAYNTSTARDTEINAMQAQAKHYWWDSEGAHVAAGTNTTNVNNITQGTSDTYGFNSLMAPGYLSLKHKDIDFAVLATNSLTFYRPATDSSNNYVQGKKAMDLTANALTFYEPLAYNSSSDLTAAATLNANGLILSEGGLEAGTKNTTNYIYLYSKDDATNHTLNINNSGNKSDWRIVAGNKFGVDKAGNLYASNATVSGAIDAYSGQFGSSSNNYWVIDTFYDANEQASYSSLHSKGDSFIQLGDSNTWTISTDKINSGWRYMSTNAEGVTNPYLFRYKQFTANGTYYDYGMHIPSILNTSDQNAKKLADKFLFIRYANYVSDTNLNVLETDANWTYPFYVDSQGNVRAAAFYIGSSSTPIGGGAGTIAEKLSGPHGNATQPIYFDNNGVATNTTYALNAAGAKGVDTSMPATATDNNVPTTKLMKTFVEGKGYITGYTETDPTVPSWAKASTKPSYALSEITSADDIKAIEALTGTSGFLKKTAANTWSLDTNTYLTSYTETDPIFVASAAYGITSSDINNWNSKTSNTGTVTSVAASGNNGITISGSPITTSGTITIGLNLSTAINTLTEGTAAANRNDYIIAQYVNGGTTTTTYHRRKLSNIFAALNSSDITTALGFTPTANTGTVTSVIVQGSNGLTGSGTVTTSGTITLSHSDTSSQASSSNSGRTYIQSITLDDYGHVTGLSTATETVTDTHYNAYLYDTTSTGTSSVTTNTTDPYLTLIENGAARSRVQLKAGTNITSITANNGVITFAAKDTTYTAATAAPGKITSTSAQGSSTNYARQDHTHGIDLATGDNNGQVKIAGTNVSVKGLGSWAYKSSGSANDVGLGNVLNITQVTDIGQGANGTIRVWKGTGELDYEDIEVEIVATETSDVRSAQKLSSYGGASNQPIYIPSSGADQGKPVAISYEINKSVPSDAKFTDTTYTFANGTNGFTVTPLGGTAQTVTVTPSIANNVTGSGTNGYIVKWNGTNTVTNGPAFSSTGTGYLKEDGTWGTPGGTYSLPLAADGTRGGVQIGYASSGKNYAVQLSSEKMYVNVPWTDTKVTTAALTSGTTYYPILATGENTATRQIDSTLGGLKYTSTAGTTSVIGTAILQLGNATASGAANNEQGVIRLYGPGATYYIDLKATTIGSSNKTITFPNKTGTVALGGDTTSLNTTNITIADHSTTTITGVSGSDTASKVTIGSHSTDYGIKSVGSFSQGADSFTANTPTIIDTTKFNGGSYSHSGFSGGSFTTGSFSGGSLIMVINGSDSNQLDITFTAATHGNDTFTAASYGTDSFTAASFQSGFYTAGTAASFTQGTDTFTAPTLGSKIPTISASNVTVPQAASQITVVTGKSHSITDNGHTHTI